MNEIGFSMKHANKHDKSHISARKSKENNYRLLEDNQTYFKAVFSIMTVLFDF